MSGERKYAWWKKHKRAGLVKWEPRHVAEERTRRFEFWERLDAEREAKR